MLTCFSSKFICSTLVFLYSKDVVFLGLTFETVLGRSLLQECCILLFSVDLLRLVFRSFFILMAVLFWIGSVRMVPLSNSFWNEKVYWPKSVVQVLLFLRNSKSAIFYFNRFRFPLESDVRRNSFFDCTGSLSFICFFWLVFPVMMIPERFRSSAANYLFTVHWNQSFQGTFLVSYSYMKRYLLFFEELRFVTLIWPGYPFQHALAVFFSLLSVDLFSSTSY